MLSPSRWIQLFQRNFRPPTLLSSTLASCQLRLAVSIKRTQQDYNWATNEIANAQIYLVRDEIESNRAKFLLTNQDGTLFLTSSYYDEIYDNERWVLAVRVKPTAYPIIGSMLTSSSPTYEISFYGVNHEFGEVQNEFTVTASLNYTSGSSYLSEPKRLYVGAHRQNFTGSVLEETDVQVGACRFWMDYLTDTDLKGHSKISQILVLIIQQETELFLPLT